MKRRWHPIVHQISPPQQGPHQITRFQEQGLSPRHRYKKICKKFNTKIVPTLGTPRTYGRGWPEHWEQVGSTSGYILASLLLDKWSLWSTLNWSKPCLIQIELERILLIALCQEPPETSKPSSSSHAALILLSDGEAII